MASVAASSHTKPRPEVRTSAGMVRGAHEGGVAVFLGMPFAAPPVGARRFAAPHPVEPWAGVREAVAFGPPPPQPAGSGADASWSGSAGDEWLTVNVWSPAQDPGAGLPTMVWIHGGGYTMGRSSLPEYDGARLAREGRIVVVSFDYRVGFEGFGWIEGAPPDRGLLDQVAALSWVQENIARFGGDPARVTVFGESAGAGSIAALLAMPRARGLFRAAILQSVPGTFFSPELAARIASRGARELGLRATLDDLATVPPELLCDLGEAMAARMADASPDEGPAAYRRIAFAPVVDGEVLPITPWQALAEGSARDIPLVIGHTRHEQRLFTGLDGLLGQVTDEQAQTALDRLAPGPDGARRYRADLPTAGSEELYDLVNGDWLFRMPTMHLAEAHVKAGGRTHLYELTWPAPGMGGSLGACHGLDVPLVFGNLDRGLPALLIGDAPNPEAEALSARMRSAWTAFATDGDPGWVAYDGERRLVQLFDAEPVVTTYPEEASRRIWADHVFGALPPGSGRRDGPTPGPGQGG